MEDVGLRVRVLVPDHAQHHGGGELPGQGGRQLRDPNRRRWETRFIQRIAQDGLFVVSSGHQKTVDEAALAKFVSEAAIMIEDELESIALSRAFDMFNG